MMVSITLPSDVNTAFGLAASASSLICLRNSVSSFARVLRDPKKNKGLPSTSLQRLAERTFGQPRSTLSRIVRDASEGLFWGITSLACGALAMLALDPQGRRSPVKSLQNIFTIHQSPALFSEEFATRLNPLNYSVSLGHSLGESVESVSKSLYSTVRAVSQFFSPPPPQAIITYVNPKIPSWRELPKRLTYEIEKSHSLTLPILLISLLNIRNTWQIRNIQKIMEQKISEAKNIQDEGAPDDASTVSGNTFTLVRRRGSEGQGGTSSGTSTLEGTGEPPIIVRRVVNVDESRAPSTADSSLKGFPPGLGEAWGGRHSTQSASSSRSDGSVGKGYIEVDMSGDTTSPPTTTTFSESELARIIQNMQSEMPPSEGNSGSSSRSLGLFWRRD